MMLCDYKEDFEYPLGGMHFHLHNKDFPIVHYHNYWEFFIVLDGTVVHRCSLGQETLSRGDCFLVHPEDVHSFTNISKGYLQVNLAITDDRLKGIMDFIDEKIYPSTRNISHPIKCKVYDEFLTEMNLMIHKLQTVDLRSERDKYLNLMKIMWVDCLKNIYMESLKEQTGYPIWLDDFIYKIKLRDNIGKPVSELAVFVNFSYTHLERLFKKYVGESIVSYMAHVRLNYAGMLLKTTDMGIEEISSNIGYESTSHFLRSFRKHFGMTPTEYRKSAS